MSYFLRETGEYGEMGTYSFAKVLCKSRDLCGNFCKAKSPTYYAVYIYALTGFSVPSLPSTRNPRLAPGRPRPQRCAVVPRRCRRLDRALGAPASHGGDCPPCRSRRHHPRVDRWRHDVRPDGRCRRLAGHRLAATLDACGVRGAEGDTREGACHFHHYVALQN